MPRLWVLASRHSGDNTQLMALADALGWPWEVKRLAYRWHEEFLRLANLTTLAGVDLERSSPLKAPWPDIVICAGRSTEAVARWIKRYGNPELRTVFVGTPWASPSTFDLVITTPQYGLGQGSNILHNALPMHAVTAKKLREEAERWAPRLAHLPAPRTAVLVGGNSGPYLFRPEAAARLGRAASALAAAEGGSLLITTSARTPTASTQALEAAISVPSEIYRWSREASDNPFHAFLGLADRIIVTGDSISMLAEACATGKPVFLFDIEDGPQSMRAEGNGDPLPPIHWRGRSLDTTAFRLLMRHAPTRWSRDLRIVHREAVAEGLVSWMGEAPRPRRANRESDLDRAVSRVRQLFGL